MVMIKPFAFIRGVEVSPDKMLHTKLDYVTLTYYGCRVPRSHPEKTWYTSNVIIL